MRSPCTTTKTQLSQKRKKKRASHVRAERKVSQAEVTACAKALGQERTGLLEEVNVRTGPCLVCTLLLPVTEISTQVPARTSETSGILVLNGRRVRSGTVTRSLGPRLSQDRRPGLSTGDGTLSVGAGHWVCPPQPVQGPRGVTHLMLKGAISRTTYCRSLGSLSLGIFEGSKSGG